METQLTPTVPTSQHFRLEALADGVWAALHAPGGWGVCNAGIIDMGSYTLVFDPFLTPDAAQDLRRACLELTGRLPSHVLLSHYHNDHVRGSQAFPEAVLVAGSLTRALLDTKGREELAADRQQAAQRLEMMGTLAASPDPLKRRAAETFVPYWEALLASAPRVALRLPDLTIGSELVFHGPVRRVVARTMGAGHSEEDLVLWLPDDGVLFCGDLLFVGNHPYLGHGDAPRSRDILTALGQLGARAFVPGHGPVADDGALAAMRGYILDLEAAARRLAATPVEMEALTEEPVPEPYREWELAYPFYGLNLRHLVERERGWEA